ncbi:G-protein coupled receptor 4-like [Xiphophorus hellerii]|uniref:G-protein coupled receptor 4-like n=1 Tax=Xiphophorus hellerii TaxID=8084 RepID=UPI0013B3E7EB|nr:G-protein coupled receptor 4-like [Xiphophorus hellerii]
MEMQDNTTFNNIDDFNITNNSSSQSDFNVESIMHLVELIVICTGLPLMLVAICAVYCLIQKDHSAPVYIINLLISDLIQLCCLAAWKAGELHDIISYSYLLALTGSVGFMVCISLERYLVIAKPLWYRFRRNIKMSLMVCAVVWTLAFASVVPCCFNVNHQVVEMIFAAVFLLPFPILIFFLIETIKALSAAYSVPAEEKRRIVTLLVVVLLIYTLLFLPNIIWSLVEELRFNQIFDSLACICLCLSPLADVTMYFCIRKSAMDKLLKSCCHCEMLGNQKLSSTAVENTSAPCTNTV